MKFKKSVYLLKVATTVPLVMCLSLPMSQANPTGAVVTKGAATISSQGPKLTIQQTSQSAYINWKSFNIGAGETTSFVQPSSQSLVWNRINDANPSQILGHLNANGLVVLQNTSGFYVGGQAAINTAGLIMTTSPSAPPEVFSSGAFDFNAPPPTAKIINYGEINVGAAGSVFLIAHDVENHGNISAPGGSIGLVAGKQVLLSQRPDGRGLSAQVTLPEGSVDNSGRLIADAGSIAMRAQIVNQGGLVQANSVRERNGVIELVASDSIKLAPTSVISANGDSQGVSAGGNILIKSGDKFVDSPTSTISVKGGAEGGNGGQVEISAIRMGSIESVVDGRAAPGFLGGTLLIDPKNITLTNFGGTAGSPIINKDNPPDTLILSVSSFSTFSQIRLQATENITLGGTLSLPDSATPTILSLQAGGNVTIDAQRQSAGIIAGLNWSVSLVAGADFLAPTSVISGKGSISLLGNSSIDTQNGSISLVAGKDVLIQNPLGLGLAQIGSQGIRTRGGGSISVIAKSGNVNAGTNPKGYSFGSTAPGYTVSSQLGGIGTVAGGNVTIDAGGDVTAFLPSGTSTSPTDGGVGAFGLQEGVVSITAGGSVFGHYVAANSRHNGVLVSSTITAKHGNAGLNNNILALSLASGGWTVMAQNGSIALQEVRNPNGVFNGLASGAAPFRHLFDYSPDAFLNLKAPKGGILLGQSGPPRYDKEGSFPIILPPRLIANAGPGGITLGNNLILFPSPIGELHIATTATTPGTGSFNGGGFGLTMSDSGATKWTSTSSFTSTDHAAVPVQINNFNAATFDIAGDLNNVIITTSKKAEITVGGNMKDTSVSAQNLHEGDTTFFHVTGDISTRNVYAFATLPGNGLPIPEPRFPGDKPNYFTIINDAVIPGSSPSTDGHGGSLFPVNNFVYNEKTKRLGYNGPMTPDIRDAVLGTLKVKTYDPLGHVVLDAQGNYVTADANWGVDPGQLVALFADSQNSADPKSSQPRGYQVGGSGHFEVTAHSLDLGIVQGLSSVGPAINPSLAKLPGAGADISIVLDGNLSMISSAINSLYGGAINIYAGGNINVGSQELLGGGTAARGIWSSGHSDVNVIAHGNIDVAGSRIAAFAGGNIFVKSETGNVDAGSGGDASVKVNTVVVNPVTGQVTTPQQPISGSGILATTLPDAPVSQVVGNIRVETPQGSITASQGGIVQEPLNGNTSLTPTLTLLAGTRDAAGNVIHTGDINAGQSGVIGVNTTVNAAGNITGLFIARGDSTVNAAANVTGTFLAGGSATFNSGGNVSVLAIAGNSINIGSGAFQGIALSQNVSGSGAVSSLAASSSAAGTSTTAAAATDNAPKAEATAAATAEEEEAKRRATRPLLARTTGRVTVILPKSN